MHIFVTFLFFLTRSSLWEEEGVLIWSLKSMEAKFISPYFRDRLEDLERGQHWPVSPAPCSVMVPALWNRTREGLSLGG